MPVTSEQINLLLAQQEEILLTLSEINTKLSSIEAENKKAIDMKSGEVPFNMGVRG